MQRDFKHWQKVATFEALTHPQIHISPIIILIHLESTFLFGHYGRFFKSYVFPVATPIHSYPTTVRYAMRFFRVITLQTCAVYLLMPHAPQRYARAFLKWQLYSPYLLTNPSASHPPRPSL